jgi:cytochrome P450
MSQTVEEINLFTPEVIEDPYPTWRLLRENDPVHYFDGLNLWILTRFEDVHNAFRDDRLSIDYETYQVNRMGPDALGEPYYQVGKEMLVCKDPPDHTRLRRIFRTALTPEIARSLAPIAEQVAKRCVEEFADRGQAELMHDYAAQVPVTVTSMLLGIPREDHEKIADLIRDFAPTMAPAPMPPEQLARTNEVCDALMEYFARHVERKRENPGDDLTSALIRANAEDEESLHDEELLANMPFLYFAGQDTQTNLLGNVVVALDRNRDQLAWLLEDPSRVDDCLHELLRYDTSGQLIGRTAREDVEMAGKTIQTGHTVMLCMGAANRDPEHFEDPEKLNLQRPPRPASELNYISFGAGRHRCLGIYVAQTNFPITLRILLEHLPFESLRVDYDNAERCMDLQQRGYDRLPIEWSDNARR